MAVIKQRFNDNDDNNENWKRTLTLCTRNYFPVPVTFLGTGDEDTITVKDKQKIKYYTLGFACQNIRCHYKDTTAETGYNRRRCKHAIGVKI